jgi:hypothetical protein
LRLRGRGTPVKEPGRTAEKEKLGRHAKRDNQ